ncbi:glycoside hydrolase family 16 protein [Flagelloscypha sp. PMI_526]|nr:glycoside hydrolase family 16 protein [Flagelloscypha sp. PMI_526]
MSTAPSHEFSRSRRRHRSYRDRDSAQARSERIPVPVSDPANTSPTPTPGLEFEREPSSSHSLISRPKKHSRRRTNTTTYPADPPLPRQYSHGIAHHIATGEVGLGYGPYQDRPLSHPNSATVPQYVWENDKQLDQYHDADPVRDKEWVDPFSARGWMNVGGMIILAGCLLFVFMMLPILDHFVINPPRKLTGLGVNASGQIPEFQSFPSLIDKDTPESAYERTGNDGQKYELVFSDEFEVDGRTFWPGDDPFWEAADLHYWATNNLEWYDPKAVTTYDGKLVFTFSKEKNHDLNYTGAMITGWNKLCFTTAYIEVSLSLPGSSKVPGLWPGVWSMGNLGRPGYGASTEGMWPYSYDSCDSAAVTGGNSGEPISYLPGQRVSACTCPGHDHPGPEVTRGRGVPEIDILEAQIDLDKGQGEVSQSYQIAPYDYKYDFRNSGPFQQACSVLTLVDPVFYEGYSYTTYGYEWYSNPSHRDQGFITWYSGGKPSWHISSSAVAANPITQVNNRLIPEEPMYLILNLGMSNFFQKVDFNNLKLPVQMFVDYVRVYQRKGTKNGMTCDPPDYPTKDYINNHLVAYTNPNLTTWASANFTFPRNSLYDGCG